MIAFSNGLTIYGDTLGNCFCIDADMQLNFTKKVITIAVGSLFGFLFVVIIVSIALFCTNSSSIGPVFQHSLFVCFLSFICVLKCKCANWCGCMNGRRKFPQSTQISLSAFLPPTQSVTVHKLQVKFFRQCLSLRCSLYHFHSPFSLLIILLLICFIQILHNSNKHRHIYLLVLLFVVIFLIFIKLIIHESCFLTLTLTLTLALAAAAVAGGGGIFFFFAFHLFNFFRSILLPVFDL